MSFTRRISSWVFPALCCSTVTLCAQTNSVTASGAVEIQDSQFRITGTVGQACIGTTRADRLTAGIGFWKPENSRALAEATDVSIPDFSISCTPNPVVKTASILVTAAEADPVSLAMYDLFGREVRTLLDQHVIDGQLSLQFDTDQIPSGRYSLVLSDGSGSSSIPILINH